MIYTGTPKYFRKMRTLASQIDVPPEMVEFRDSVITKLDDWGLLNEENISHIEELCRIERDLRELRWILCTKGCPVHLRDGMSQRMHDRERERAWILSGLGIRGRI